MVEFSLSEALCSLVKNSRCAGFEPKKQLFSGGRQQSLLCGSHFVCMDCLVCQPDGAVSHSAIGSRICTVCLPVLMVSVVVMVS